MASENLNPYNIENGMRVWCRPTLSRKSSPRYPKKGGKYSCQGTVTGLKGKMYWRYYTNNSYQPTTDDPPAYAVVKWDTGAEHTYNLSELIPATTPLDWPENV